ATGTIGQCCGGILCPTCMRFISIRKAYFMQLMQVIRATRLLLVLIICLLGSWIYVLVMLIFLNIILACYLLYTMIEPVQLVLGRFVQNLRSNTIPCLKGITLIGWWSKKWKLKQVGKKRNN